MPIRVEDFDRGGINIADYVGQVMRAMPGLAFTEPELREEVEAALGGLRIDTAEFDRTLALMEAAGTMVHSEILGVLFWALSPRERAKGGK